MPDYIYGKLPNRVIPLTRDCDWVFGMARKDALGDPVDWDGSIYMLIDIDRAEPTRIDGEVADENATIKVESEVANLCRNGTTWRVVLSGATDPTTEIPLLVGKFERNDGK